MGCAGSRNLTQGEIDSLDAGPYPDNYQSIIKAVFNDILFDPYSAQYEFYEPVKFGVKIGGHPIGGWLVQLTVNAKNRFGGYVGKEHYAFF